MVEVKARKMSCRVLQSNRQLLSNGICFCGHKYCTKLWGLQSGGFAYFERDFHDRRAAYSLERCMRAIPYKGSPLPPEILHCSLIIHFYLRFWERLRGWDGTPSPAWPANARAAHCSPGGLSQIPASLQLEQLQDVTSAHSLLTAWVAVAVWECNCEAKTFDLK